jgi:hypothetical protein
MGELGSKKTDDSCSGLMSRVFRAKSLVVTVQIEYCFDIPNCALRFHGRVNSVAE